MRRGCKTPVYLPARADCCASSLAFSSCYSCMNSCSAGSSYRPCPQHQIQICEASKVYPVRLSHVKQEVLAFVTYWMYFTCNKARLRCNVAGASTCICVSRQQSLLVTVED